ncbi:hypothetical protein PMM47T1_10947 [Pseudomonas sp. M47T1]|uniref:TIR domain-containing protein n=1 Tax=unclassified Pseudomonas TaxID=196821 RepID=UPI0002607D81|nr:TIR domain-containing protein [Pseudomonas sp. M47T1]EIK96439.1 hypothetical protein PMM47T1_10947 [Pseudomonas sp. M47T1]
MSTYHLFISHSWDYSDAYERLLDLLGRDTTFNFKSHALPAPHPIVEASALELEQAIVEHLQPCSALVIMAGVYPTYGRWIDKEIEVARRLGKAIIAIKPFGAERISPTVRNAANAECAWSTRHIIGAITLHA